VNFHSKPECRRLAVAQRRYLGKEAGQQHVTARHVPALGSQIMPLENAS
jgi:hypothetical protein